MKLYSSLNKLNFSSKCRYLYLLLLLLTIIYIIITILYGNHINITLLDEYLNTKILLPICSSQLYQTISLVRLKIKINSV